MHFHFRLETVGGTEILLGIFFEAGCIASCKRLISDTAIIVQYKLYTTADICGEHAMTKPKMRENPIFKPKSSFPRLPKEKIKTKLIFGLQFSFNHWM